MGRENDVNLMGLNVFVQTRLEIGGVNRGEVSPVILVAQFTVIAATRKPEKRHVYLSAQRGVDFQGILRAARKNEHICSRFHVSDAFVTRSEGDHRSRRS